MSILSSFLKEVFNSKEAPQSPQPNAARSDNVIASEVSSCLSVGNIKGAAQLLQELIAANPEHPGILDFEAKIHAAILKQSLPGPDYLDWLQWFQTNMKPATYLEIGVENGQSLQYAKLPTLAVGIDPGIQIVHQQETWVKLFKLPSDDFFVQYDLKEVFGGLHVDLAFIDGLHTFDQALKDFINIERYSSSTTIALFHDILPIIPVTANRERNSIIWLGDTWKTIALLIKHRPDLKIFTIPTHPSGLTVVAKLNASNNELPTNVGKLIQEGMAMELSAYMPEMEKHLNVVSNDFNAITRLLQDTKA